MIETPKGFATQNFESRESDFDFLAESLDEYTKERKGDELLMSGRVRPGQTVRQVGHLIFEKFEDDLNATLGMSGNNIIVAFIVPVDGIRQIEFTILPTQEA